MIQRIRWVVTHPQASYSGRMSRIPTIGVATVLAVVLLSACASASPMGSPTAGRTDASRSPAAAHPADLMGMWRVTGGASEGNDSWVRFGERGVTLWRECGVADGSWAASNQLLVADLSVFYGQGCYAPDALVVDWFDRVERYRSVGGQIEVLDQVNAVVTTLVDDDSRPQTNPDFGIEGDDPEATAEQRAALDPGTGLPAGVVPATEIVGKWVAADATSTSPEAPFVEFAPDGSYTVSEGCNLRIGRWVLGDDGEFVAAAGGTTDIGCDPIPIPDWVDDATHLGMEIGDTEAPVLTLHDREGNPLGRLTPADAQ
jgi:hypothetical protein